MSQNSCYKNGLPFWAGTHQPYDTAPYHYLVAGCTGSGKSVTIQLLMQSVLPKLSDTSVSHRAMIYDSKQDLVPTLAGIVDPDRIHILNPFHKLGSAWDIAKDVSSPAVAYQIAEVLIPAEKNASQPFFTDAARHLLAGVFIALQQRFGEEWTLRDVLQIVRDPEHLARTVGATAYTEHLRVYFQDSRETSSVMSTMATKMARFEPIAGASEKVNQKFSLKEWVKSNTVLVLSSDETTRSAFDALNQAVFQRASQILLGMPDHPHRRTWIFLDEVREAGKLEGLSSLLNRGRSKGACLVLGFQDIEGLRDVYGEHLANELVGQCGSKAIFRLQSPETAKWAEGLGGSVLREERSLTSGSSSGNSQSFSASGASVGKNSGDNFGSTRNMAERKQFYDSEFLSNPFPSPNSLHGFYFIRQGFFAHAFNPFPLLSSKRSDVPSSLRRDNPFDELIEPWSAMERLRLERVLGVSPADAPSEQTDATASTDKPQSGLRSTRKNKPDTEESQDAWLPRQNPPRDVRRS